MCLLIAGCAPESEDKQASTSQAIDGAAVFAENCAVCHLSGRAPKLESIKALPQSERGNRMRNHPRAGDLLDRLTAATLLDLIDFLKGVPPDATQPEGPGSETFIAECGGCHVNGRGPRFVELGKSQRGRVPRQDACTPRRGRDPATPDGGATRVRLIDFFDSE